VKSIRVLFAFISALTLCSGSLWAASDFEIIGNQGLSVSQLSVDQLKDIYLGKKLFWDTNVRILPAYLDFSFSSSQEFLTEVLGLGANQFLDYWRRKLFSGRGIPPKRLNNVQEILEYVQNHPGSIGVVPRHSKMAFKNIKVLSLKD